MNYPVDTSQRYVFWDTTSGTASAEKSWPVADGGPIPGLASTLIPLLVVRESVPVFDRLTHRLVKRAAPVIDLDAGTYTVGWTLTELTIAEQQDAQNVRRALVKREASRRIEEVLDLPLWRQNNLQTHALLTILPALVDGRSLTQAEQDSIAPLVQAATAALAIRTRSDVLETQAVSMTQADWDALDLADNTLWS